MKSAPRTRAVVFDLDGTLVDSMPLVLRAFAHALRPHCGELTEAQITARLGGSPDRTMRSFIEDESQVPEAMRRLLEYDAHHRELIRPFAGMHGLLDHLRGAGHALGLWTGRERQGTLWILEQHRLAAKLDGCVCGDDLPTHKPHPAGLEETLRQLRAGRDEALFVGDADVDVLAGHAHGVRTLLIAHDRKIDASVRAKAWHTVTTPAEAYAWLQAELTSREARAP